MPDFILYPFSSAPCVPFKFDGRILYTSEAYELVFLTLQPGEMMDMHALSFDVVFFVVEGTGMLKVGDEIVEVIENNTVFVNRDVSRAWSNSSYKPLRILVNKIIPIQ